jgi:hypothetical protein
MFGEDAYEGPKFVRMVGKQTKCIVKLGLEITQGSWICGGARTGGRDNGNGRRFEDSKKEAVSGGIIIIICSPEGLRGYCECHSSPVSRLASTTHTATSDFTPTR